MDRNRSYYRQSSEPINPISPGSIFKGTIRFENFSDEELGALLFAIDLPAECCHKLGMGKPLGLGSVRLDIEGLTLIDRKKRYSQIFDENGQWETGKATATRNFKEYINSFSNHIFEKLLNNDEKQDKNNNPTSNLWHVARMNDLKIMLTYNHNSGKHKPNFNWPERTRYMEIEHHVNNNEFKPRPVLPYPSEVIKGDTFTDC